jgi:hypothetical protein
VEVVQGDVLGAETEGILESGTPVILFVFNSFGAEVMGPLMAKVSRAARDGRIVDMVYVHPDQDRLVGATPGAKLLNLKNITFSEEDARADVFGVKSDVCSVYRIAR